MVSSFLGDFKLGIKARSSKDKEQSLVTETFYWDEEEVSDEEEVNPVKVLMALADDELTVGKIHARNGKWVDVTKRMVNALLSMDEDAEWQNYLKNYPKFEICGSYGHSTSGHNHVIHIKRELAESSQSNESSIGVKCDTYGSTIHSTNDDNEFDHFKKAERKNRNLIEAARTMMNGLVLSKYFWTEAVRIACYTHNISIIIKRHDKTPYEIFRERILDINYFYVFGCLVFIHNHKDHLGKINAKANDGYFLGHSFVSKAFRGFNTRRKQIKETYHVTFNESMEAIRFTHTLEEKIGIHDSSRYPLDEFVHEDDPSRQYQIDSDILNYVIPHGHSLSKLTRMTVKLIAALASECLFADFLSEIELKKDVGFLPGILINFNFTKDPSKVTGIELTAHMITVNNQKDSVSLLPLSIKPKKGKSQTMTPTLPKSQGSESFGALSKKSKRPKSKNPPTKTKGTRKSQPLPESATINPKDSVRNKQPIDMGLTSMASDEGTPKTTSCPEGSLRDKDSGGNKQPVNMEPINPTVADPSGTGAKELDTQPLVLSTYADVRAFLLSDDEAQESEDDILGAGEEMEKHQEATVNYANLKAYQTDKLLEASMSSFEKSSTTISDLYKGLNIITKILKEINNAVNDDPVIHMKINEATKSFTKISTYITEAYGLKQDEELAAWAKSFTNMAWNLGSKLLGKKSLRNLSAQLMLTLNSLVHLNLNLQSLNHNQSPSSILNQSSYKEKAKRYNISLLNNFRHTWIMKKKPEVIKVVWEEAKKLGIHLKEAITSKAGEKFKKAQDAEHEVLKRQHTEKVRKFIKLRKHNFDNYMWTISSKLKPEIVTNVKIHPKTKPVVITVLRGTDGRNYNVHKPFAFGELGISELDELREIIPKKKNAVVQDLMNSLSQRHKRKHMELEPEIKIPSMECNRAFPGNVLFVNNMVIEEPEHGIFFADEFGKQAFQRWSDIGKVRMKALVSYLVAASMVQSPENAKFSMKLKKLIVEHIDQEKHKSKKVKLEALGYEMN
nr:retrovirus-related Pol polyprotein from transposon TNT 1-94 [Tanacetum cinerariifolium]